MADQLVADLWCDGGRALRVWTVRSAGRLVGLVPLLARRHLHGGVLPFVRLELLGSGEPEQDEICSDYLGPIALRGWETTVATALVTALRTGRLGRWDELSLTRLDGESPMTQQLATVLHAAGWPYETRSAGSTRYARLPRSWEEYLESIGSDGRCLIRRSLRDFDAWAGTRSRVERATDQASLARGQTALLQLHAERWRGAGRPSLFDSRSFRAFHDAVMPVLLRDGVLDLRWLLVDDQPIAALYNFVWDGRVQFYQAGRSLELPRPIRAGVVLHASAIRDAIAAGHGEYDFLAGSSQLKRKLGPCSRPLVELRVAPRSWREHARRAGSRARRWAHQWVQGRSGWARLRWLIARRSAAPGG